MTAFRHSLIAWLLMVAAPGAWVLSVGACGGSSSSPSSPSRSTPPVVTALYISVTGNFLIGAVGGSTQLRANANTTSGLQDVTGQATWRSSDDAIATVSSGGLVSARAAGLVVITASYQGLSGLGGISVTTVVNVTGRWIGTSVNPTSSITLQLTQSGDSLSGTSTVLGGNTMYGGRLTGTVNGGTVILAGSVLDPAGNTYSSWSDERCALENPNTMMCLNPMTDARGNLQLLEVTLARE